MKTLIAAFIVSIVWFILGGILYMNPFSDKLMKKESKNPAVRKWKDQTKFLASIYFLGVLLPSIIFAYAFRLIKPALPADMLSQTLYFGLILIGLKVFPKYADMSTMSTYPKKLMLMDIINGSISAFAIALTLSYIL